MIFYNICCAGLTTNSLACSDDDGYSTPSSLSLSLSLSSVSMSSIQLTFPPHHSFSCSEIKCNNFPDHYFPACECCNPTNFEQNMFRCAKHGIPVRNISGLIAALHVVSVAATITFSSLLASFPPLTFLTEKSRLITRDFLIRKRERL